MGNSRTIRRAYWNRMTLLQTVAALVCCLGLLLCASPARAGVTWTGDVVPADPTTWTSSTSGTIGDTGIGTVDVTGGSAIISRRGIIGYLAGSSGTVTVDGAGSTWTNSGTYDDFHVGSWEGTGVLNITNGGLVTTETEVEVSRGASDGTIQFDGGILTTWGLNSASADLTGTGTINTHGLVSDVDLIFDSTHGYTQTVILNSEPGQNITVNLDVDGKGALGVGHSGAASMTITDGRDVESTAGYIGDRAGSSGTVTVSGSGTNWTVSGYYTSGVPYLYVGRYGTGVLNITNGAAVNDASSYIGREAGSVGTATVDGAGSSWTSDIYSYNMSVGHSGTGTLDVTNGGTVSHRSGSIGYGAGGSGTVTVDGVGSSWTNTTGLGVGGYGTGVMAVTNGGTLTTGGGTLGRYAGGHGTMTVDGAGSNWTDGEQIAVGLEGTGVLDITNGGSVNGTDGYVGDGVGSSGTVTVSGVGSSWSNSYLYLGNEGTGVLDITTGGSVSSSRSYVGNQAGSEGTITVDGAGSTWANTGTYLYIGYEGDGELNVINGGSVSSQRGYIGYLTGSSGAVTVDGIGSGWVCTGRLSVGSYGGSTLDITNGGMVSSTRGGVSGTVTVDGAGSTWTDSGDLSVGSGGSLNILNNGVVTVAGDTWVSDSTGSPGTINLDNTTLTTGGLLCTFSDLAGTGTIDTHGLVSYIDLVFDSTHGLTQVFALNAEPGQNITLNLDVDGTGAMGAGYDGVGTMTVTDGLDIASTEGQIGRKSGSDGTVTVDGAGSSWTNTGELYVGWYGTGEMSITGGATVSNTNVRIAYQPGSSGTITVDGAGSIWTNTGYLELGRDGTAELNILNGGVVSNTNCDINDNGGPAATATVDGAGSRWTNTGDLKVGEDGPGVLNITNGGAVSNATAYVASSGGSSGTVLVDGVGSTWTNTADLYVGNYDTGVLNVSNGGAVGCTNGTIGRNNGASGTVTVDGIGSTWTNTGDLTVGLDGQAELNITGGGAVSSAAGYIGSGSGYSGTVTVDGSGSTWTNSGDVHVASTHAATMTISDGATVSGLDGYIGYGSGSSGLAIVTGAGSSWVSSGDFHVGYGGNGVLRITGDGLVSVDGAFSIDDHFGSGGQVKMRSGGMLALAGDADGSLLEFLGLVGGTDDILYWDALTESWDPITGATYGDDYFLTYAAGYTTLTVGGPPPPSDGDFNGDGEVTVEDIDALVANVGDPAYDVDGDGDCDADDLVYLVENLVQWSRTIGESGVGTQCGDANLDGLVNVTDLALMLPWFGQATTGWAKGNFNVDGAIDATDLAILKSQFGFVAPGAPVPEPMTLGLLGLGGLALRRRRKA